MKVPARDWGKRFFCRAIFTPGMPEAQVRARAEALFVLKALRLRRGDRLLDLCCGTGRHSFPLARKGLQVTGLDATPEYLKEARRLSRGNPAFVRGDMRRLPYKNEFDAAINLWTSFGYFLDEADDMKTLKSVAKALKPGGAFLIDVINAAWLRKNHLAKNWRRRSDGAYVLEDVSLTEGKDPGHVNTWTVLKPGKKPVSATFYVRSYDRVRLARSLRRAGLVPAKAWGGLDGSPFRSDSVRLVLLARKPGAPADSLEREV